MSSNALLEMDHEDFQQAMPGVKQDTVREVSPATASEPQDTEGGEDEGETRCICKELDPPDDSGLYIQCEQCGVWQHGYCVGISDGEDSYLEKYWCEQCRPELHNLHTVDSIGTIRSIYQPIQEKRKQIRRNSRQKSTSDPTQGLQSEDFRPDSSNPSPQWTPEKNSTNDSRDSHSRPSRSKRSGERAIGDSSKEMVNDLEKNNDNRYNKDNNNGNENDRPEYLENSVHHEDPTNEAEEDDKKLTDRKRATFSAREEKHYQWMLEKAIRESRRTSRHDDDSQELEDGKEPTIESHLPDEGVLKQEQEATGMNDGHGSNYPSNHSGGNSAGMDDEQLQNFSNNPQGYQGPSPSSSAVNEVTSISGAGGTGNSATKHESVLSRSESMNSEDNSKRPRKTKRGPNRSNRSMGNGNGLRTGTPPNGKLELGVNKPMKPRLPSQRTSLNEMRKRVAAILEFISRTQWELSEDQSSRDDLVRFVENQQFIQQVDTIFESHDHTLKLMDDLTRSLLLWEKKYSHGSNLQV